MSVNSPSWMTATKQRFTWATSRIRILIPLRTCSTFLMTYSMTEYCFGVPRTGRAEDGGYGKAKVLNWCRMLATTCGPGQYLAPMQVKTTSHKPAVRPHPVFRDPSGRWGKMLVSGVRHQSREVGQCGPRVFSRPPVR